ncbi:hypothetical protein TNCV_3649461 [Trichonephila clavipes]|nr:hypothetical protein TNCV_3649461 [Trichonephila clavipes]
MRCGTHLFEKCPRYNSRTICLLQYAVPNTINTSTSSLFEYEFTLLPPETDRKGQLPAGSVFTKSSIQRHLPQDCPDESSRTGMANQWHAIERFGHIIDQDI